MGILDAIKGLSKLRITSVNSTTGVQVPVVPGLGQLEVVDTSQNPTMSNIPSSWSRSWLGPGKPFTTDTSARDRDAETEPRSFQYITSVNSTISPRIAYGLTPFTDLRNYAETVPEVAMCVRLLTEEMKAFVPTIVDDKEQTIEEDSALKWMTERPDKFNPWPVWLSRFLYNVLVYDAGCAYFMRDSRRKIVGSRVIDGSTIFVVIDEKGEQPMPPAPAFSQVIWGMPRGFYNTKQVWYKPRHLRTDSPYGRSPIEDALPAVKLLRSLWDYEFEKYQIGNIPEMCFTVPEGWKDNADAILEYEEAFNARMSGSNRERVRARFLPAGMAVLQTKEMTFNKESYDAGTNSIRMAFGVLQSEVGDAPTGGLGGSGYAEAMQSAFYRMGLAPLISYVESHFNDIIKANGIRDRKFKLEFPAESLDPSKEEEKYSTRFQIGGINRDEYRTGIGMDKMGGDEGNFIIQPGGGPDDGGGDPFGAGPKPGMIPVGNSNRIQVRRPIPVLKRPIQVLSKPVQVRKADYSEIALAVGYQGDMGAFADGVKEEMEHSETFDGDMKAIAGIAADHLQEDPDYYLKMKSVMEKGILRKGCGVTPEDDSNYGAKVEKPLDVEMPSQGANDSIIVAMGDKVPAVWKPESGEKESLNEWVGGKLYCRGEAAYLLDRELAPDAEHYLIPVTFTASIDDERGSVQQYVQGRDKREDIIEYRQEWVEQAAVLDYIMGQVDRERKNYLTHPYDDERPILIDSDLSFPVDPKQNLHSSFVDAVKGKPLPERLLDMVYLAIGNHDLWEDLKDVLDSDAAVENAKARAMAVYDSKTIPSDMPDTIVVKNEWENEFEKVEKPTEENIAGFMRELIKEPITTLLEVTDLAAKAYLYFEDKEIDEDIPEVYFDIADSFLDNLAKWEEGKHPRDKGGEFTSKGGDGAAGEKGGDTKTNISVSAKTSDLWTAPEQEITSSDTSINDKKMPRTFSIVDFKEGTRNADIGGGRFDNVTEYLSAKGVENIIYDPFNRSKEWNEKASSKIKDGQSDTATVNNVLNVIKEPENRSFVISQAANAIKPSGIAYFLIYEKDGNGIGAATSKGWQNNMKTAGYLDEVKIYFKDVTIRNGLIVAKDPIDKITKLDWFTKWDEAEHPRSDNGEFGNKTGSGKLRSDLSEAEQSKIMNDAKDIGYLIYNNGGMATKSRVEDILTARHGIDRYAGHMITNWIESQATNPSKDWGEGREKPRLEDYPEIAARLKGGDADGGDVDSRFRGVAASEGKKAKPMKSYKEIGTPPKVGDMVTIKGGFGEPIHGRVKTYMGGIGEHGVSGRVDLESGDSAQLDMVYPYEEGKKAAKEYSPEEINERVQTHYDGAINKIADYMKSKGIDVSEEAKRASDAGDKYKGYSSFVKQIAGGDIGFDKLKNSIRYYGWLIKKGKREEEVDRKVLPAEEEVAAPVKESKIAENEKTKLLRSRPMGVETTAVRADNPKVKYKFRWRVVSIDDLVMSHTPSFDENPDFPAELQPRMRERAASQLQVAKIARELDPDSFLWDTHYIDRGTPLIGPDLVVESGNGRSMGLRAAVGTPQYDEYVTALKDKLKEYGMSPDAAGIKNPVLVRERITPVDRVKFVHEANNDDKLKMSPVEQALQDGKNVKDTWLDNINVGENQTVEQALKSTSNLALVRSFVGSIPENERNSVVDAEGQFNLAGVERLKQAMFAYTFPGNEGRRLLSLFAESQEGVVKNVSNSMYASLGQIARAEGMVNTGARDPGLSIGKDVSKVVDVYARLKQNGMSVNDFISQGSVFERELNTFQEGMLRFINENGSSPRNLREGFRSYADAVIKQPDIRQISMYGDVPRSTKEEVWNGSTREIGKIPEQENRNVSLF